MWGNKDIYTQMAHNYFRFLQNEYNMHITRNDDLGCIRFESEITWLELWYEQFTLSVAVGIKGKSYTVSLFDIVKFMGEDVNVTYMASTEERLEKGMQLLSDCVKKYAQKALLGDIDFYEDVMMFLKRKRESARRSNEMKYLEELARTAWENKNFSEVIRLYNSKFDQLTPLQRKKLNYALKHKNDIIS